MNEEAPIIRAYFDIDGILQDMIAAWVAKHNYAGFGLRSKMVEEGEIEYWWVIPGETLMYSEPSKACDEQVKSYKKLTDLDPDKAALKVEPLRFKFVPREEVDQHT